MQTTQSEPVDLHLGALETSPARRRKAGRIGRARFLHAEHLCMVRGESGGAIGSIPIVASESVKVMHALRSGWGIDQLDPLHGYAWGQIDPFDLANVFCFNSGEGRALRKEILRAAGSRWPIRNTALPGEPSERWLSIDIAPDGDPGVCSARMDNERHRIIAWMDVPVRRVWIARGEARPSLSVPDLCGFEDDADRYSLCNDHPLLLDLSQVVDADAVNPVEWPMRLVERLWEDEGLWREICPWVEFGITLRLRGETGSLADGPWQWQVAFRRGRIPRIIDVDGFRNPSPALRKTMTRNRRD